MLTMVMGFIYIERRVLGRMQARLGPNRTGPFGLLQPVADAVKVLLKENIVPANADKIVHWLAPIVAFVPVLMIFAVVPFQNGALLADLNIGMLYIVAISSISTVGVFMAGWGSSNKYSLLGAMRNVAAVVSYEIPLVLSIVGVVLMAGSLSLNDIVIAPGYTLYSVAAAGLLTVLHRRLRRDQPQSLRPAGSRFRTGGRVPYRVFRHEIRHVLPGGVCRSPGYVRHYRHPFPGRLARPAAAAVAVAHHQNLHRLLPHGLDTDDYCRASGSTS